MQQQRESALNWREVKNWTQSHLNIDIEMYLKYLLYLIWALLEVNKSTLSVVKAYFILIMFAYMNREWSGEI